VLFGVVYLIANNTTKKENDKVPLMSRSFKSGGADPRTGIEYGTDKYRWNSAEECVSDTMKYAPGTTIMGAKRICGDYNRKCWIECMTGSNGRKVDETCVAKCQ